MGGEGGFMCNTTRHIIKWLCLSALLCASVSCGKEMDAPDTPDVPSDGEMTLQIGFKVPTRAATEGYEDGETNENYIDIAGGNYRIYFFDGDNKFIARFEPSGFITIEGSDYTQYSVLGKAPDALVTHRGFKMVVLANWPEYPEDLNKESNENLSLKKGETTIADICNADWAQYDCLTDGNTSPTAIALNPFAADPSARKLMPFYGVHEYKGVTFTSGIATILDEPVTLLRAMAKVEVILEVGDNEFADDLSFSSLKINQYNAKGYCAPKDVFHQDDYNHEGDDKWEQDYVHVLHLVNDKNDDGEKEFAFRHVQQWNEGGKRYDKWVAYLPEYQNIGVYDAYSSIKAKFNIQLAGDTPHTIYFANYNGGKTDNSNGNRLNIERNNIYRFYVECKGYDFNLQLFISDWEGLYENNFEYGNGQIVSPLSPWEGEINNDVEL